MSRIATITVAAIVLLLVTFANPITGNVLGFCPISERRKAIGVDAIAATIDALAVRLTYRGLRS